MNNLTLLNKTQLSKSVGSPSELQALIESLYDEVSKTLTLATEALDEAERQASDVSRIALDLQSVSLSEENSTRDLAISTRESTDESLTSYRGKVVESATWMSQYSTNLDTATNSFATSESLENTSSEAITAHSEEPMSSVHSGLSVIDEPYYDSAGHTVGRSTIVFRSNGVEWRAPADPNPEGPPKFPYFVCNVGQSGPVRVNSYAGSGEGQPLATWETCTVLGDAPFKFIWQFRTFGTSMWKDFAEIGGTVSTGHNKINTVETTALTTPYWKTGDSAWTTARSSKITIQPHSRDEHGVRKIFDVRCLVINQATAYTDSSETIPVTGYATSSIGSMYSSDKTDSFVVATALHRAGLIGYESKTNLRKVLSSYITGEYELHAVMGYHALGVPVSRLVRYRIGASIARSFWNIATSVANGRKTRVMSVVEFIVSGIGYVTGGRKEFKRYYDVHRHRFQSRSKFHG